MSIGAISYVLDLPMSRSTDKQLLTILANYADEDGFSYPSQMRMTLNTALDRKTVIEGLKRLVDLGHIRDSGVRVGQTKQVIVWQVLGVPQSATIHYVYRTTDPATGEYYIGKRSVACDPALDLYRGSGRWVLQRQGDGRLLVKEELSRHGSAEEAIRAEYAEISRHDGDPKCQNYTRSKAVNDHDERTRTVPKAGRLPAATKGPVFPTEESRFSHQRVPKTGHGTVRELSVQEPLSPPISPPASDRAVSSIPIVNAVDGSGAACREAGVASLGDPAAEYIPRQQAAGARPGGDLLGRTPDDPPAGAIARVVAAWNNTAQAAGLSGVRLPLSAPRATKVRARVRAHGLDQVLEAITKIGASRFCRGDNDRGWRADFDFVLQDASLTRALEGRYDDRDPVPRAPRPEELTGWAAVAYRNRRELEALDREEAANANVPKIASAAD